MRNKLFANCLLASTFVGFTSTSFVRAQEDENLGGAGVTEDSGAENNVQENGGEVTETLVDQQEFNTSDSKAPELSQSDDSANNTSEDSAESGVEELAGGYDGNGTELNATAQRGMEESEKGGEHVYTDGLKQTNGNGYGSYVNKKTLAAGVGVPAVSFASAVALYFSGLLPGSGVDPSQSQVDTPSKSTNLPEQPLAAKKGWWSWWYMIPGYYLLGNVLSILKFIYAKKFCNLVDNVDYLDFTKASFLTRYCTLSGLLFVKFNEDGIFYSLKDWDDWLYDKLKGIVGGNITGRIFDVLLYPIIGADLGFTGWKFNLKPLKPQDMMIDSD